MCFKSIDYLAFAVTIMVKARKLFKRTASYLVVFYMIFFTHFHKNASFLMCLQQ